MHTTRVVTKDGRALEGVLWTCRPEEGWFTLNGVPGADGEVRIQLRDAESVVTVGERVGVGADGAPRIADDDVLARWRESGRWDGR